MSLQVIPPGTGEYISNMYSPNNRSGLHFWLTTEDGVLPDPSSDAAIGLYYSDDYGVAEGGSMRYYPTGHVLTGAKPYIFIPEAILITAIRKAEVTTPCGCSTAEGSPTDTPPPMLDEYVVEGTGQWHVEAGWAIDVGGESVTSSGAGEDFAHRDLAGPMRHDWSYTVAFDIDNPDDQPLELYFRRSTDEDQTWRLAREEEVYATGPVEVVIENYIPLADQFAFKPVGTVGVVNISGLSIVKDAPYSGG